MCCVEGFIRSPTQDGTSHPEATAQKTLFAERKLAGTCWDLFFFRSGQGREREVTVDLKIRPNN